MRLSFRNQILRVAQADSVLDGKLLRTIAGQQHVLALFQDRSCEANGITDPFHGNDGSRLQCGPIHEDRIELSFPIAIEMRTDSVVEYRLVFKLDNCLLTGIESRASAAEHIPPTIHGALYGFPAGFEKVIGNLPGSAMNHKRDIVHREIVVEGQ